MEKLARFFNDIVPLKLLDIGTGSGNFIDLINTIYKDYQQIIGIDTIDTAIKSANKNFVNNEKVSIIKMDAANMTFEDESFDLVCLSNSLHHLADIKVIFEEMNRVLKINGYLMFAEMTNNNLTERQQSHLLLHHFSAKIDRLQGHIHNDTYADEAILQLCKENTDLTLVDNWILHYERKKENSDEEIQWLFDTVDRLAEKMNNEEIFNEAKEIKEYIRINGFDSCPTMIVVMKK